MRIKLLLVTVILACNPVRGVAATSEVPFQLDANGRIIVRVSFQHGCEADFLLDTGSTGSAISQELADRMGLQPVARAMVVATAGAQMRPLVPLGPLAVGMATANEVLASVMEAGAFKRSGLNADGILGQDFLARFDFTLDYRRRRLVWDLAPAESGAEPDSSATRLALVLIEDRLIAEVDQREAAGSPLRLVPDSGAAALVFYETSATRRMELETLEGGYQVGGLAGEREARAVRVRELRIGGITLRNQLAVLLPSPFGEDVVADGLLPLHLFARVTFRSSDRSLLLWKK